MNLFILIYIAMYIVYHILYFNHAAYMCNYNKSIVVKSIIVAIINFAFFYVFIFHLPVYYISIEMIIYAILLTLEFKYGFKESTRASIFAALMFGLNLYAKKFIAMGFIAFIMNCSVAEVAKDINIRLVFFIVPYIMSVFSIQGFKKYIKRVYMDTILSDKRNVTFLISIFSAFYVAIAISAVSLSVYNGGVKLNLQYILAGSFSLLAFVLFIIFAYVLAHLQINHENYKQVKRQNKKQLEKLKILEKQATTDDLTGLYTRKTADDYLQECINTKKLYFLVFMDIDGLKIANDVYGHNEGDFYIKTVAHTIKAYFNDDIVSRYGGDEIVAIGEYETEEEVMTKTVQCYNAVLNISNKYNKQYNTSVSYGIVTTTNKENLTAAQIIKLADERMYHFKKMNNRAR